VESRQGISLDAPELLEFLRGKIASWWLPDQILEIDAMPLAATGKIDKNQLRSHYANGKLNARESNS
jgi:3-(methylthio)propionyl---CoA ligase